MSLSMQMRSLMLHRYFFSMRLCTLRLQGSSGEFGSEEANGERGGDCGTMEKLEEGFGSEREEAGERVGKKSFAFFI